MPYLDIIIFAVIAAFLLTRLWSVLGRRDDDGPQRSNPFATPAKPQQDEEDVMVLPDRAKALPPPGATSAYAPDSLAGVLERIREIVGPTPSPFDEKEFLQGAKTAFAMIVGDFAKGDMARSARILAPPVLERFRKAIGDRVAAGQTLEHRMDRIADAGVTAARLEGDRALVTVDFTSHQVNVTRDAQGNVMAGTPGRAGEIHDRWIFARDLKSADPNWQLVETEN
jgi:predicted lipid-binding transport protein (Tim44 family)